MFFLTYTVHYLSTRKGHNVTDIAIPSACCSSDPVENSPSWLRLRFRYVTRSFAFINHK